MQPEANARISEGSEIVCCESIAKNQFRTQFSGKQVYAKPPVYCFSAEANRFCHGFMAVTDCYRLIGTEHWRRIGFSKRGIAGKSTRIAPAPALLFLQSFIWTKLIFLLSIGFETAIELG